MKLEPIERVSLVDTVVERIRNFIENKHLESGDRLPTEPQLAARLGVSRTVLREALGRLETIGLLTVQRGRGMFVGDRKSLLSCVKLVRSAMTITPKDWLSFAEFRAAIECDSARRAANRASDDELNELQSLCERMDDPEQTYLESVQHDFRFHLRIVELGGNELMRNVMEVVQEFVIAGMVQTTCEPRDHTGSQRLHRELVDAIRSRNPETAERAMRKHMDMVDAAMKRAHGIGSPVQ